MLPLVPRLRTTPHIQWCQEESGTFVAYVTLMVYITLVEPSHVHILQTHRRQITACHYEYYQDDKDLLLIIPSESGEGFNDTMAVSDWIKEILTEIKRPVLLRRG